MHHFQTHLELLSQAENNNLKLIAFNALRSAGIYSNVDQLIKHAVHALHPVELTLFDLEGILSRKLEKMQSRFTFDVLRTDSDNTEWARLQLAKSIKPYKSSKVGKGARPADTEGGVEWQLEIRCDGEPKD
jgi:hypothetical protein